MHNFLKDRYGADELTAALGILGMLVAVIGGLTHLNWLIWLALILLALAILRAFSKNRGARRIENVTFMHLISKLPKVGDFFNDRLHHMVAADPTTMDAAGGVDMQRAARTARRIFNERDTTLFFRCRNCGAILSVPKGKGHIRVTCPRCGAKTDKES
ncbi:MAG: hypothetical protein Q4B30_02685 [Coriobacteriaceae bacterium]|nr:hypothetical protein [Coriobacteriaceae bacterium]